MKCVINQSGPFGVKFTGLDPGPRGLEPKKAIRPKSPLLKNFIGTKISQKFCVSKLDHEFPFKT